MTLLYSSVSAHSWKETVLKSVRPILEQRSCLPCDPDFAGGK